jgi:hypothetical protein
MDGFSLANSMTSVLSLFVHGWIPVCVIKDYTVSSCQVDTYTATPCRRNEAENLWIEIKLINHFLPSFDFH